MLKFNIKSIFVYDTYRHAEPKEGSESTGAAVLNRQLRAQCGYWKSNSCHLQEEYVLLTAKPILQTQGYILFCNCFRNDCCLAAVVSELSKVVKIKPTLMTGFGLWYLVQHRYLYRVAT